MPAFGSFSEPTGQWEPPPSVLWLTGRANLAIPADVSRWLARPPCQISPDAGLVRPLARLASHGPASIHGPYARNESVGARFAARTAGYSPAIAPTAAAPNTPATQPAIGSATTHACDVA